MPTQKRHAKQFLVILFIVFVGFLGISMPYLIFPALFLNPDYTILPSHWEESTRAILLGITLAAYPFGQFIGSPILGSLSDDYGRKPLMSGSLFIAALCNLLTGFATEWQHLGFLIFSRFVAGIMEGNIAIARGMAADMTTISKHESFGKINAVISIAFLLGPLVGGILTDKNLWGGLTISFPFYFICCLFFVLSVVAALILEGTTIDPSKNAKTFLQRINLSKRLSELFLNRRLKFLLITSTCFTLAADIFYEFGPVYLTIKWNLGPSQMIMFNAALCAGLAIGNGFLPKFFSTRFSKRFGIVCSTAGLAIFLIGIISVNSAYLIFLLFGLAGLMIGIAVTLLTVKISNSVSDDIQGEVMGVQLALRVLGDAIICLFGGLLLLVSSKLIIVFAAFTSLAACGYYIRKL